MDSSLRLANKAKAFADQINTNDNYKSDSFSLWYQCQFCSRAFGKCEDFLNHKIRAHLNQFLQSQSQNQNQNALEKKKPGKNVISKISKKPKEDIKKDGNEETDGIIVPVTTKIPISNSKQSQKITTKYRNLLRKQKSNSVTKVMAVRKKVRKRQTVFPYENDLLLKPLEGNSEEVNPKVVRNEEGRIRYECRFCHKLYTTRVYCLDHESIHLGVRNHKCKFCPRTFTWIGDWQKHQRLCAFRDQDEVQASINN